LFYVKCINDDIMFIMLVFYSLCFSFFFFNAPATTEIYTLSLHDALPIWQIVQLGRALPFVFDAHGKRALEALSRIDDILRNFAADRKSTRLNSSHDQISYAVFCLKKKKQSHHK